MHEATRALQEQYETPSQQRDAAHLGMWVFLATEVLFFGGLFTGYAAYRNAYFEAFGELSKHLNVACGTINTAVLLTSSLTMALAVHVAKLGKGDKIAGWLSWTAILGLVFMGVKAYEYADDFKEGLIPGASFALTGPYRGPMQLLLLLYYIMTGIHALHLTIGIFVVWRMRVRALLGEFSAAYHTPIEVTGLYWHFVDIIWVFLYPMLYLIKRY